MAQQSKTALTSRPLTKALGTASILSLAIAGANVANAIQTDIGVDYKAQFFVVDSEAFGGSSDTDTGFANLLRVRADFKHEATGVSVHTVTQLAGDRWSGDSRGPSGGAGSSGVGSYSTDGNETVTLDQGFVRIPYGNRAVLNVGRQATSWNNCFLVCDDRRDRINTLFPTALGTVVLGYDRRADTVAFNNPDNGDMINAGLITRLGGFNVGLLWVHWFENSDGVPAGETLYSQQGTHIFSPYIQGQIADNVNMAFGLNWVGQNANDAGNGLVYADNAWSQYLRLGTSLDLVDLNFQAVLTQDGGLVSPGFDTYSSLLNSNPESTANPTSLVRMGGAAGREDYEEMLFIAQAAFKVSPALSVKAAIGYFDIDNSWIGVSDNSMVYDLQAHYRVNEAVSTSVTWGMITKNDAGVAVGAPGTGTSGNSLVPGSGGVSFNNDDLMAASLNLHVKF